MISSTIVLLALVASATPAFGAPALLTPTQLQVRENGDLTARAQRNISGPRTNRTQHRPRDTPAAQVLVARDEALEERELEERDIEAREPRQSKVNMSKPRPRFLDTDLEAREPRTSKVNISKPRSLGEDSELIAREPARAPTRATPAPKPHPRSLEADSEILSRQLLEDTVELLARSPSNVRPFGISIPHHDTAQLFHGRDDALEERDLEERDPSPRHGSDLVKDEYDEVVSRSPRISTSSMGHGPVISSTFKGSAARDIEAREPKGSESSRVKTSTTTRTRPRSIEEDLDLVAREEDLFARAKINIPKPPFGPRGGSRPRSIEEDLELVARAKIGLSKPMGPRGGKGGSRPRSFEEDLELTARSPRISMPNLGPVTNSFHPRDLYERAPEPLKIKGPKTGPFRPLKSVRSDLELEARELLDELYAREPEPLKIQGPKGGQIFRPLKSVRDSELDARALNGKLGGGVSAIRYTPFINGAHYSTREFKDLVERALEELVELD